MSAAFCCEDWGASGGWRGVRVICFPPLGNLDNLGALHLHGCLSFPSAERGD